MGLTTEYQRLRITGTLTCEGDLHLGDGDVGDSTERPYPQGNVAMQSGHYATVCTDVNGKPYLPGSSLRGALRDIVQRSGAQGFDHLFGHSQTAGRLRIYDARWLSAPEKCNELPFWNDARKTCIRHGIAIDPITRTADNHKLFQHELVPAGSCFELIIEVDKTAHEQLLALLHLLNGWDGQLAHALGSGRGKGWGGVRWKPTGVEVVTQDKLEEWLLTDAEVLPWTKLEMDQSWFDDQAPPVTAMDIALIPQGPFLIHETGFQRKKVNDEDQNAPDLEFDRTPDGYARIPGSTLRGWVRARAHRIAATIAHQLCGIGAEESWERMEPLIEDIFGTERSRGYIWFSDAVSANKAEEHNQTFIAVDRFTGGVAKGALYQARAAKCAQLTAQCTLDPRIAKTLSDDVKGLLWLILRDAMEGDLTLGWGQAKGYGAFSVLVKKDNNSVWSGSLNDVKDEAKRWIEALHKRIQQLAHVHSAESGTERQVAQGGQSA